MSTPVPRSLVRLLAASIAAALVAAIAVATVPETGHPPERTTTGARPVAVINPAALPNIAALLTTTTTAPPPTTEAPPASQPVAYHGNPAGEINGYPCGGDLPPCFVLRRESDGDPLIWNGGCHDGPCPGGSTASGLWQFLRTTWARFAGYLNAADAPPSVQNEKARLTWAGGRGCSHWAAC